MKKKLQLEPKHFRGFEILSELSPEDYEAVKAAIIVDYEAEQMLDYWQRYAERAHELIEGWTPDHEIKAKKICDSIRYPLDRVNELKAMFPALDSLTAPQRALLLRKVNVGIDHYKKNLK